MSNQRFKVLVVGATGSIGQHVIDEGARLGYAMRALIRRPQQAEQFDADTETVVGDLTDATSLFAAVAGMDAVVFTHGSNGRPPGPQAVDYGAVRNVLLALEGRTVRIALMTTVAVTDRKGAHDWKRRGERLVRASGLPYTIVRPGWFDYNNPQQQRLIMLQGDRSQTGTPRDGAVGRRQLAQVLLWSLHAPTALCKTFELSTEAGQMQVDLGSVAMQLDRDTPRALDAVHDMQNMPIETEPTYVLDDLDEISAAFAAPRT